MLQNEPSQVSDDLMKCHSSEVKRALKDPDSSPLLPGAGGVMKTGQG